MPSLPAHLRSFGWGGGNKFPSLQSDALQRVQGSDVQAMEVHLNLRSFTDTSMHVEAASLDGAFVSVNSCALTYYTIATPCWISNLNSKSVVLFPDSAQLKTHAKGH